MMNTKIMEVAEQIERNMSGFISADETYTTDDIAEALATVFADNAWLVVASNTVLNIPSTIQQLDDLDTAAIIVGDFERVEIFGCSVYDADSCAIETMWHCIDGLSFYSVK